MTNISKFPNADAPIVQSFRSKENGSSSPEHRMSKKMFGILNPAGRRIANFNKKNLSKKKKHAVSRDIRLHEESPEVIDARYGNVRVITVKKEDALRQLRNQRSEYSI